MTTENLGNNQKSHNKLKENLDNYLIPLFENQDDLENSIKDKINSLRDNIQSTSKNKSELKSLSSTFAQIFKKTYSIYLKNFFTNSQKITQLRNCLKIFNEYYDEIKSLEDDFIFDKYKAIMQKNIEKFFASHDSNKKNVRIRHFIGTALSASLSAKKKSYINRGGYSRYTSYMEIFFLKSFKKTHQSNSIKTSINSYLTQLQKSYKFNLVMNSLKNRNNLHLTRIASKKIHDLVLRLDINKSLYFDIGFLKHKMRAIFTKKKNKKKETYFEISYIDGCRTLQSWKKSNFSSKVEMGSKCKVCLSYKTSESKFEKLGREYIQQLILMDSKTIHKNMSDYKFKNKLNAFLSVFLSLNSKNKYKFRHFQTTQKARNCYAKRLQISQKLALGNQVYKKFRLFVLNDIHKQLIQEAKTDLTIEQNKSLLTFLSNKEKQLKQLTKLNTNKSTYRKSFNEIKKKKEDFHKVLYDFECQPKTLNEWKALLFLLNLAIERNKCKIQNKNKPQWVRKI